MKRVIFGRIAILLLAVNSIAIAQDAASDATKNGPMTKLRADLTRAVQNGHLTDTQKNIMQHATTTLRQAAQDRQNGEKVDRDAVKKALSDIKEIINSDAFLPEDKEVVKADLEALKEKVRESREGRRPGLFRR